MTEPRDVARDPRDLGPAPFGEEPDPTGVRAILSALPDPGPMPVHLVRRISASLAAEGARDEETAPGGQDGQPGGGTVHSLAQAREARTLGGRLPTIAVAASIVVLAGVVVMGLLAMTSGLGMGAGYDSAAEHAGSDSGAGQRSDGGGAEPFGSTEMAPQSEDSDEGQSMAAAPSLAVLATGVVVDGSALADHARTLRDDPAALGHDAGAERAMATSPVASPEGAADCLGGLLSISPEEALDLMRAVDVVRFEGALAALLLAGDTGTGPTSGPTDPTGMTTAYLVPLDCGPRRAVLLHDPVTLPS